MLLLTLESVNPDGSGTAIFTLNGKKDDTLCCRFDAKKSLCNTEWWKFNKSLVEGQDVVLNLALYEYIHLHCYDRIYLKPNQLTKLEDRTCTIIAQIMRKPNDTVLFEKILVEKSTPTLKMGVMKKAEVISLELNADVLLVLEDTMYHGIMNYLKDPEEKNLIEPRDAEHKRMYTMFYDLFGVTKFLAPFKSNWSQLYRVDVLERVENTTDEFRVLYIDIAKVAIITLDKFACMTQCTNVLPMMQTLPPQVFKGHLYELMNLEHSISKCVPFTGISLMVKMVEEAKNENNNISSVIIYRCARPDEDKKEIVSFNDYLRLLTEKDFDLAPMKLKLNTQEVLHDRWKQFKDEKDVPNFVDELYDKYFFSTSGLLMLADEEGYDREKAEHKAEAKSSKFDHISEEDSEA